MTTGNKSFKNDPIITSIQNNAIDFAIELRKLAEFSDTNYEAVVAETVVDLFRAILERTPIDTGRAIANWFIDFDPESDPGEYDYVNARGFDYSLSDADTIWIYNNLEYIIPLEEGWSDQAPQGMVALSLREFSQFLSNSAKKQSDIILPD